MESVQDGGEHGGRMKERAEKRQARILQKWTGTKVSQGCAAL